MKVRIVWNGVGGELDSITVNVAHMSDAAISAALVEMITGNVVTPGDSFAISEIND